jgi:hypothetical protein
VEIKISRRRRHRGAYATVIGHDRHEDCVSQSSIGFTDDEIFAGRESVSLITVG